MNEENDPGCDGHGEPENELAESLRWDVGLEESAIAALGLNPHAGDGGVIEREEEEVVNVTVGLPIVRTSPDHGTAFDVAGTGPADPSSTVRALCTAAHIARRRSRR